MQSPLGGLENKHRAEVVLYSGLCYCIQWWSVGPWHVAAAAGSGSNLSLAVLSEMQRDQFVSSSLQDG